MPCPIPSGSAVRMFRSYSAPHRSCPDCSPRERSYLAAAEPESRCLNDLPLPERREYLFSQYLRFLPAGGEHQLCMLGRLIGAADAGEVRKLARARELVE